ncbi:MAG: formate dehydrogenase accessory protein FdhE [bacterium]
MKECDPRGYLQQRLPGETGRRDDLIALFGALYDCQHRALAGQETIISETAAALQPLWESGNRPLGKISLFCRDWPGTAELFAEIERVTCGQENSELPGKLGKKQIIRFAQDWIDLNQEALQLMAEKRWNGDLAQGRFILIYTLYPFMSALSERLSLPETDDYAPRCPVCGGGPLLASLTPAGKENQRFGGGNIRRLHCSFCGTSWVYSRPKCPFCQEENPEKLGFFELPGLTSARVDYCDTCKRYLKTLREFPASKMSLLWEDVCTCKLDLAAGQQGYC